MSISIGAVSSAQTYASLVQTRSASGSDSANATDPLTVLLRLASPPANQANPSANSSPPAGGSNGAQFSPDSMMSLLSAQGQQKGGETGASSGTDDSDGSSADAQGATTTITTNPDGSITTTTTYADGTVQTATTPASSAVNGAPQNNGASSQSDAGQLLKMLSQGVQALAPAAALLAIL